MSQGVTTDTPPDPLYISLHTADPGESPDGSTELSATNYDRQALGSGNWTTLAPADVSSNGHGFENGVDVEFDPASSSWGTISHVALWDSLTGGNALASYQVSNSKSIDTDEQARFLAGELKFVID
jgi:hypothetical protein